MSTEVLPGSRFCSGHSHLWAIGLVLCVVTAAGCPSMIALEYQPTNPLRGHGTVGTAPFRYQPSEEGRVRPRQVETNRAAMPDVFLAQEIGVFVTEALRLELGWSGYTLKAPSDRIVSGTITRFHLNWRREEGRSFELSADFTVQSGAHTLFSWHCSSVQKGSDMLRDDGILIRKGTADCMHRFIETAQDERIL